MAVVQRVAPPQRSFTDHELVAAARRGSDRAFAELYVRYGDRVRGFITGLVEDHGRAEDITQEVFLSAVRRLRVTETPIAFKPWVFEIARNACIDELRRARRSQEVALEPDEVDSAAGPTSVHSQPPEAAAEIRQQLHDLRGAFHGLSAQQHRLIVLRELEGRSYEEIGDRLHLSRTMVESGLFRARRKLGQEYGELVSGRRCEVVQSAIAGGDERRLRALGVRHRRQLARHLSHCQPCRRVARAAGLDDAWLRPASLAERVAALLPLPWLRWPGGRGLSGGPAPAGRASEPLSPFAQPLQSFTPLVDPAGPWHGLGRLAAALAALLVAGVGGSVVTGYGIPGVGGGAPASQAPGHSRPAAGNAASVGHSTPRAPSSVRARTSTTSAVGRPVRAPGGRTRRADGSLRPTSGSAPPGPRAVAPAGRGRAPAPTVNGVAPVVAAASRAAAADGLPGAALAGAGAGIAGQAAQGAADTGVPGGSAAEGAVAASSGSVAATAGTTAAVTAGSVLGRAVHPRTAVGY